jgi:23S rRNA (guanosine2251-2'-O)-methyltransferase
MSSLVTNPINKSIILIVDNIRSAHNVGALFRTSDAFQVEKIILCGITPYPKKTNDLRPPHVQNKVSKQIAKTALGAEKSVSFEHYKSTSLVIKKLKAIGFNVYALEQAENSNTLSQFKPAFPCALIIGNEVDGISKQILAQTDSIIEIPMHGRKESLNASVAGGIALYALTQVA